MQTPALTPARLAIRLVIYFVLLFGAVVAIVSYWPDVMRSLPLGGHDALDTRDISRLSGATLDAGEDFEVISTIQARTDDVTTAILFLSLHLSGTILLMIPVSWTYMAIRRDIGYQKNFARALIVLPICATTIVLLIQDSLALAFGLAALVTAVRFRVALDEAIDGIFVFAAVCVGLAAGIGYLGIAAVMIIFFCFAIVILWFLEYGENPVEQARHEKKLSKLTSSQTDSAS